MLFDLEDYRVSGFIGTEHRAVDQVDWLDAATAFRATRDAYMKTVSEYYISAQALCEIDEMAVLDDKMNDIMESNLVLQPLVNKFFNALASSPIVPGQAINIGDRFNIIAVAESETPEGSLECTVHPLMQSGWKRVAIIDPSADSAYEEMTQALYDSVKTAYEDFQGKVKSLILTAEGVQTMEDYVAPPVSAWNDYPSLDGYVRGVNSLPIKDAVVRFIDADGTAHEAVTDSLGHYKFSKEVVYNSFALGATGEFISGEFDMFLLDTTVGGTELYDKTSIFQNSFFGAENDREKTWKITLKGKKANRRNFKLEIIEDYSDFPSIKGHVKDQDGNPVKDALVALHYIHGGQWLDENYNKTTGSWRRNTKISLFGDDKSLLTDENGYYEYPSQYVGEWFHKSFLAANPEWQHTINESVYDIVNGYTVDEQFIYDSNGDAKGFDSNEYVYAIAEQADGKFLVGGYLQYSYDGVNINKLIRINGDGTLDTTFTPQFGKIQGTPYVKFVKVLSDGKILVAGAFDSINETEVHNIARLNSDGTLDETFSGEVFSSIYRTSSLDFYTYSRFNFPINGGTPDTYVNTVEVQADGKILVGGYFYIPQVNSYGMFRLNSDGTLDETFMNSNSLLPSKADVVAAISDKEAKQVIFEAAETERATLYTEYERLDGIAQAALSYLQSLDPSDEAYSAAETDYNTKLSARDSYYNDVYMVAATAVDTAVATYNAAISAMDQAIDNYFNPLTVSNYIGQRFGGLGEDPFAIALQSDGKILVGGGEWMNLGGYVNSLDADGNVVNSPASIGSGVIRLETDGSLDSTFSVGTNFLSSQPSGGFNNSYIRSLLVQSDSKIIVTGNFNHFGESSTFPLGDQRNIAGILRLNSDGTLDPSFDISHGNTSGWTMGIFPVGDEYFAYGDFGVKSMKLNGEFSSVSVASRAEKAFKTSDNSVLVFGTFTDCYDIFGNSKYVQGMVKFKTGPVDIVKSSKTTNSSSFYGLNNGEISYNGGIRKSQDPLLNINDFRVVVLPYTQDEMGGVITPDDRSYQNTPASQRFYDYTDWFNSRFQYAWNERNEMYIDTIVPGENVIDVEEVIVDPEAGAEKVYFTVTKREGQWDAILFSSNSGYIRIVDELGNKYSPGNGSWFDFNGYVDYGDTRNYYAYSCNSIGGAEGKIGTINIEGNLDVDLTELTGLTSLTCNNNPMLQTLSLTSCKDTLTYLYMSSCTNIRSLNVTGCSLLNQLDLNSCRRLKTIAGLETLSGLTNINLNYTPASSISQTIEGEFSYEIDEATRAVTFNSKSRVDGEVTGVVELPDGSSIYVGTFNWAYYTDDNGQDYSYQTQKLVKFKADGSVDENFLNNIGNGFNSQPMGAKLLPDGKILIYGQFDYFKNREVGGMVKLSSTGVLDTSFITKTKQKLISVFDVILESDGSMLVAAAQYNSTDGWNHQGLVKLKANGDLDQDFKIGFAGAVLRIKKVEGYYYTVGYFDTISVPGLTISACRIGKFDAAGVLDEVFMNNTRNYLPLNGGLRDIAVNSNGDVIVCGDFTQLRKNDGSILTTPYFAKYSSQGIFDMNMYNSISVNGSPFTLNGQFLSIDIQGDKIVLYGNFNQVNGRDMGNKRYVAIDSTGLNLAYLSELGHSDSNIHRIERDENSVKMYGYWWTYYAPDGTEYGGTPMHVKLLKVVKKNNILKLPATNANLWARIDSVSSKLDISASTNLNTLYLYRSALTQTLDFSNSPNIYRMEIQECRSLTNSSW